jgi:hypothetical protein
MTVENIIVLMLPSVLYAMAGAIQAQNEKQPFDPVQFAKTIIAGALSAGRRRKLPMSMSSKACGKVGGSGYSVIK